MRGGDVRRLGDEEDPDKTQPVKTDLIK